MTGAPAPGPDATPPAPTDADTRLRLEQERDFLLTSLDDLERERDRGAIDDATYERLHDDYTARAAAVIRSLAAGPAEPLRGPRSSTTRRVLTAVGVAAFAGVCAVALAAALGARLPGQTSSGNVAAPTGGSGGSAGAGQVSVDQRIQRLRDAIAANPDDAGSRLLLARFLEARGDVPGAIEQYDAVLARQPANVEALAQTGRLLYLTAQAAVKTEPAAVESLVTRARALLDAAVAADSQSADARFFRAIVLANEYGDFPAAQNDLQRYLIFAPQGQFADQARQLLAQVTNAIDGTPVPTVTTVPPRKGGK